MTCVVLFFVALAVFLVTFPFDRRGLVLHLFSCCWAQLYFWTNPLWRIQVENRHHLPWRKAAVLVANHQSLGDILVLFGLFRPYKWVSKASVFKVPFVGWNMILNRYVPLVRGDKESIRRMMLACEAWLDRDVPVLLFPEGTRSETGEVKPFKDGAFKLSIAKSCPVIPIVVTGTRELVPKHGLQLSERTFCRVRVLEPVSPQPFGSDFEAMRDHVRRLIIDEKDRMELSAAATRDSAPAPVPPPGEPPRPPGHPAA